MVHGRMKRTRALALAAVGGLLLAGVSCGRPTPTPPTTTAGPGPTTTPTSGTGPTTTGAPTTTTAPPTTTTPPGTPAGALSTKGRKIVDRNGRDVLLQGVNWFGFETSNELPHGIWTRDHVDMLRQIR